MRFAAATLVLLSCASICCANCAAENKVEKASAQQGTKQTETENLISYARRLDQLVQPMLARNDADSMLASALLTGQAENMESLSEGKFSLDAPHASALLKRAAQRFPDDVDIACARLQICLTQSRCDASEISRRMQKMEPDNAAPIMSNIELAQKADNPAVVEEALARAASAQRYDDHIFSIQHRIYTALQTVPAPVPPGESPQLARTADAMAMAPVLIPPVVGLFRACIRSGAISQTRRSNCAAIGRLMEHGTSLTAVGLGYSMVIHTSDDPDERATAAESKRQHIWREDQMSELMIQNPAISQRFVNAFLTQPTEPAMRDAFLASNGVALNPPQDWQPQAPAKSASANPGQ